MKLVAQNNKKALVPKTGIENGSEPGLWYQKIGRDPGFQDPEIANYSSFEIVLSSVRPSLNFSAARELIST
jgi:hypothetical protein